MNKNHKSLLIIAEAAQGYEGDPGLARALVRAAAGANADALKLQLVYADELCTPDYKHYELFRSLEMPDATWHELANYARSMNIGLMLDVFGSRSLALAEAVCAAAVKVHSTDMSNLGLLQEIAVSRAPLVLLSTGGCLRDEIAEALGVLGEKDVVLLHGYQGYPTPIEGNQIERLSDLRGIADLAPRTGQVRLGFADHAPSDDPLRHTLAASALGLGACVLEKHITLALRMKMEDHESALNPDEFAGFVDGMRRCFTALSLDGNASAPDFGMHESEHTYRANTRKHVVALKFLSAGTAITPDMVGLKRTSSEHFLSDLREVYGKHLAQDVPAASAITREMLRTEEKP
ncbi:MAG: N-acetylneuraminate synthase family protein [Burkholderiales bacterium]|nr:N-acetylneuraminate synthase family protein [Burkholderiales bacterium]